MKLIKNAEILTMDGEIIKDGVILFDNKIQYVGKKNSVSIGSIDEEYEHNSSACAF